MNDAPTAITVFMYPVPENNTADQLVVSMKVIDEDAAQRHTCNMTNNIGHFYFRTEASGNSSMFIKRTTALNFETIPIIQGLLVHFRIIFAL